MVIQPKRPASSVAKQINKCNPPPDGPRLDIGPPGQRPVCQMASPPLLDTSKYASQEMKSPKFNPPS